MKLGGRWYTPLSVSGAPFYRAAFPTEHLTVGTNSKNRTEEQYPLGFWATKTNLFKPSAKKK
jgi:hypothetical protein